MPEEPSNPENNQSSPEVTDFTPESPSVASQTNTASDGQSESESPVPASEPSSATPDHTPRPWLQEKPAKSKKGLFVGLAILVALGLVGGGGWAAYALWYQNTDKVIMDALASSLTARTVSVNGTFKGTFPGGGMDLTMDTKYGYKEGGNFKGNGSVKLSDALSIKLDGEGAYAPNGDSYAKFNNLDSAARAAYNASMKAYFGDISKLPESYQKQISSGYDLLFGAIVKKVDGKWVKITAADIKDFDSKAGKQYECTQKVMQNLQNNNKDLLDLGSVYQSDKFIVVKENLGTSNGSMGFVVDVDKDIYKRFTEDIKTTKLYKDIKACAGDDRTLFDDDDKLDESKFTKTSRIELWVDQWSHKITRINGEGAVTEDGEKTTVNFDFKTQFDGPVTVTVPKADLTLKDILGDVEKLTGGKTSTSTGGKGSTSTSSLFDTGTKTGSKA